MSQEFLQNKSKSRLITSQSTLSRKLSSQSQFMKKHKYIRCNHKCKSTLKYLQKPTIIRFGKKENNLF
jgi:hypothetical protein